MRRSRPVRTLLWRFGAAATLAGALSTLPLSAWAGPAWPRLANDVLARPAAPVVGEVADLATLLPQELIAVADAQGLGARFHDLPNSSLKQRLFALPAWKLFQKSPAYVELLGGLGFVELVAGMKGHELLETLLGEQLALGVVAGEGKPGLVGAVRLPDVDRALHVMQVARQLLAMQEEEPPAWRAATCGGLETLVVREQLFVACHGRDLLFASSEARFLELATAAQAAHALQPPALVAAARAAAPADALLRFALDGPRTTALSGKESWLPVRQEEFLGAALLGDVLQLAAQAPVVPLCVRGDADTFALELSLPATTPLPAAFRGFGHARAGEPLALVRPPGTLLTMALRRDFAALWSESGALCTEKVGADLAAAKANLGLFFGGRSLPDEVLPALDEEVLFVLARQTFPGVAAPPALRYPAGALLFTARDDEERLGREFGNGVQMALALFNVDSAQKNQSPYELFVEPYRGTLVTGGRLPKDDDRTAEPERQNASPCFARVGKRLILSSTVELLHALIDELSAGPLGSAPAGSLTRIEIDGAQVAALAHEDRDVLLSQATLEKGKSLAQAELEQAFLVDVAREVAQLRLASRRADGRLTVELALELAPRAAATGAAPRAAAEAGR
ncbi:MAG: hypothetical protein JNL90_18230 [Planctomycetes bacterium]|nr:hypothetical protein [Planctomycetota bacterium]